MKKTNTTTTPAPMTLDERIERAPLEKAKLLAELQEALRAGAQGDAFPGDRYTNRGFFQDPKNKRAVLKDGTIIERR
jgi:hypothetical protein